MLFRYTSMRIEQEGIAFAKERRGSTRGKISYVEISDSEEEGDVSIENL